MHNLGNVFNFELVRTLKKKSFWVMSLTLPLIICVIFAIVFFSNQATQQASEDIKNQEFSFSYTDESGLLNKTLANQLGATEVNDKQSAIAKVKSGDIDAYFFYPQDLTKNKVEVFAKDVGLFDNSRYQAVAKALIQQSVATTVDAQSTAILQDKVAYSSTTYKDGQQFNGFQELIAPGIFLVLFYILISMFGNQMLTSTTEEKENRVTEMILTTIEARTLIIGKILSLIVLAFIQVLTILVPVIIAYIFFRHQLTFPDIDFSSIPLNPLPIALGALIFASSFMLFTGILVAVGAVAPTAKEAGGFFGVIMIFIFGPLYAVSLFVSAPESPIVRFLTFFPLTAPIPLLLRNAVGNLSLGDAIIGIIILATSATIVLSIAIRLFRYGVLAYSNKIKLNVIFNRNKVTKISRQLK